MRQIFPMQIFGCTSVKGKGHSKLNLAGNALFCASILGNKEGCPKGAKPTGGKGIALNLILGVILATFGVMVFIAILSSLFPDFFSEMFCRVYEGVLFFMPGRDKPVAAAGCSPPLPDEPIKECRARNQRDMAMQITGHIQRCWQKYSGYGNAKKNCLVCKIKELDGVVTEADVNQILIEQGLCPGFIENSLLENNLTGRTCGIYNQIVFSKKEIKRGDFIAFEYLNGRVVVR